MTSLSRLAEDEHLWHRLSPEAQRTLGEALRDRFLALPPGHDSAEARLLRAAARHVDRPPEAHVAGLPVASHPTARFHAVRFVEAEHLDAQLPSLFARPVPREPDLVAVFVDPLDLSYWTFENIVPLDRRHEALPPTLALRDRVALDAQTLAFSLDAPEATRRALAELDGLGLYVPPLDPAARGGLRFVFHSARLGELLTQALRDALPEALLAGFSHVNPVFRCNRFAPSDDPFRSHLDSPYSDPAHRHLSRYTLLLYLTGGRGQPALQIGDLALEAIAPMTVLLFDQSREHAGAPYLDGDKVFLRSELVHEVDEVSHDPAIAEIFSRACFWTTESLFAPELAQHAQACFDRAARARWETLQERATKEPFVHRTLRAPTLDDQSVHFLANGYDYWFPEGVVPLEACAALALLDALNGRLGESPFRLSCATELVHLDLADPSAIARFLAPFRTPLTEPLFADFRADLLSPPGERAASEMYCPHCDGDESAFGRRLSRFDPLHHPDVIDAYERARAEATSRIERAPLLSMGGQIYLSRARFLVRGDQIHVLSEQRPAPLHFAGHLCWSYGADPSDHLEVEATVEALHPLVPPILLSQRDGCVHLMLDLFRSGWTVGHQLERVDMVRISDRRG